MPRENQPHVGRPFNAPVRTNVLNGVFQQSAHLGAIATTGRFTYTPGAGYRFADIKKRQRIVAPVAAAPVSAPSTKQFALIGTVEVSDLLRCFEFDDGEFGSTVFWVAKPWILRGRDTWEGESRFFITYDNYSQSNQARRATNNRGEQENQKIVPAYATVDLIVATRIDVGVPLPASEQVEGEDVKNAQWLDLNTDGRMWAVTG